MDLTGYAGCWGHIHAKPVNSNTRGHVRSVAFYWLEVNPSRTSGVSGEVHDVVVSVSDTVTQDGVLVASGAGSRQLRLRE